MNGKTYILRNDEDAEALGNSIAGAHITKPLRVTVETYKKKRSLAQNALNFLWCDAVRKWLWEAGIGFKNARGETIRPYTSEEVHEWHKELWLQPTAVEINGKVSKQYRSRNLGVMDFSELLNNVDAYWAEQGLILPHPEELMKEAHGEKE